MTPLIHLRGTGRTTRMIAEAKRLAAEGRKVYVVFADSGAVFANNLPGISSLSATSPGFDMDTLTVNGAASDAVVLIDHWVIESHFPKLVSALHAFDAQHKEQRPIEDCDGARQTNKRLSAIEKGIASLGERVGDVARLVGRSVK